MAWPSIQVKSRAFQAENPTGFLTSYISVVHTLSLLSGLLWSTFDTASFPAAKVGDITVCVFIYLFIPKH